MFEEFLKWLKEDFKPNGKDYMIEFGNLRQISMVGHIYDTITVYSISDYLTPKFKILFRESNFSILYLPNFHDLINQSELDYIITIIEDVTQTPFQSLYKI